MRPIEYHKLDQVEHQMSWFRGLHENLVTIFLRRHPKRPHGVILDAGCGTGGFLCTLARALPQYTLLGLDVNKTACEIAHAKSGQLVCLGNANSLPFSDACLTAIFSADVLCHGGIDQEQVLKNFYRCLQSGGILVLNLPAYSWLLSGHDRAVHNVRRYASKNIRKLLMATGFMDVKTTYWNTILFPLMVLHRCSPEKLMGATLDYAQTDGNYLPNDYAFWDFYPSSGFYSLFGGSIIATAIKKWRNRQAKQTY